jgi:hypothetical protein
MNAASLFFMYGVSEKEASSVATFLAATGLFNDSPKVAQLNRAAEGFEFRLAVNVDPLTDEMIAGQRDMARDLSKNVLGGAPVQVNYCLGLSATLRVDSTRVADGDHQKTIPPKGRYYTTKVFHVQEKGPQT